MAYHNKMNKLPGRIYCICGDGEIAEGSIWEALAFASNYKLTNLLLFVDVNKMG
jgi:transketolase